jgi:hypothetical protein
MKTLKMMLVTMLVVLTAGFAVAADDVNVSNDNNNTNNNSANSNSNANSNQSQNNSQGQTMTSPTQLPHLQYGTNFVQPGVGIENKGWFLYQSGVYGYLTVGEVSSMRRHFQISDIFFWNWRARVRTSMISVRLEGTPVGISLMTYWPKVRANRGDKVIASVVVKGEANWPEETFLGLAAQACIDEAGSDRFAVMYTTNSTGVSTGLSVSLGGAVSSVYSAGSKGAVVTSGGQIGTIETTVEDHKEFQALCMNKGEVNLIDYRSATTQIDVTVQVATPAPQAPKPAATCNTDEIFKRIEELKREVKDCKLYCYNNLTLRSALGEAYIDLYVCTGDKRYLKDATYHFEVAERNFRNGHDISAHRGEAGQVIAQVYYNWAGCKNILEGHKSAMAFAKAKNLERIPTEFTR